MLTVRLLMRAVQAAVARVPAHLLREQALVVKLPQPVARVRVQVVQPGRVERHRFCSRERPRQPRPAPTGSPRSTGSPRKTARSTSRPARGK